MMQTLHLQAGREKRILRGHRWIFSNEIADPLANYEPGSWVDVYSAKNVHLGTGYVNPKSLIAVRLVCLPGQKANKDYFYALLQDALRRRRDVLYPESNCYRVVYGESDGLPGLIVDRYGDILVYQATTMGMAAMEDLLQELLIDLFRPQALVYRNDSPMRALEGLSMEKGIAFGEVPDDYWVSMEGIHMRVDPLMGQKTGFYLDQRDNRKALLPWVPQKRVLDLFCYNGAWSLAAARGGAAEVTGVDQSARAIAQARANAVRNEADQVCSFVEQDVFQFLKGVPRGAFDIVVLDPPAFAKTKKSLPEARKGYIDANRRALLALRKGGLLISSSCSHHVNDEIFRDILLQAAQSSGRQLRLVEARSQSRDHPVLLAMPETGYLKCFFLEVI